MSETVNNANKIVNNLTGTVANATEVAANATSVAANTVKLVDDAVKTGSIALESTGKVIESTGKVIDTTEVLIKDVAGSAGKVINTTADLVNDVADTAKSAALLAQKITGLASDVVVTVTPEISKASKSIVNAASTILRLSVLLITALVNIISAPLDIIIDYTTPKSGWAQQVAEQQKNLKSNMEKTKKFNKIQITEILKQIKRIIVRYKELACSKRFLLITMCSGEIKTNIQKYYDEINRISDKIKIDNMPNILIVNQVDRLNDFKSDDSDIGNSYNTTLIEDVKSQINTLREEDLNTFKINFSLFNALLTSINADINAVKSNKVETIQNIKNSTYPGAAAEGGKKNRRYKTRNKKSKKSKTRNNK
jgi:hypothetical protein